MGIKDGILSSSQALYVFAIILSTIPYVGALPVSDQPSLKGRDGATPSPDDPSLWLYLGIATILVVFGGAFAGLTVALMGQDEVFLKVLATSGEEPERTHAAKVLGVLKKGKHWVLVTILLSNVIVNEALPIILDRSLGHGVAAALLSTILIVIFGEILPQSVCVQYGLPIGARSATFVLALMYILAPIAWPTAKLLDKMLGNGTSGGLYKKAGLKALVSMHNQQLNSDEITIISSVLDMSEKTVGSIMTPIDRVFTLSIDDILDRASIGQIISHGYSRIPVYRWSPAGDKDFIGMLLTRILIGYDPAEEKRVRDFSLRTLPQTDPNTSCLDIINFFQEGKAHMVLISDSPGGESGAIGIATFEDVLEELIGEEIIDESDVYIDVHNAVRRIAPSPELRVSDNTESQEWSFRPQDIIGKLRQKTRRHLPIPMAELSQRGATIPKNHISRQTDHSGTSHQPRQPLLHPDNILYDASSPPDDYFGPTLQPTSSKGLSPQLPISPHSPFTPRGSISESFVNSRGIQKLVLHHSGSGNNSTVSLPVATAAAPAPAEGRDDVHDPMSHPPQGSGRVAGHKRSDTHRRSTSDDAFDVSGYNSSAEEPLLT